MKTLWIGLVLLFVGFECILGDESDTGLTEGDVRFFLHTRELGETELNDNNLDRIDAKKPTKIIIHGWMTNHIASWIRLLTDAFLRKGDFNVVLVDYEPIALLNASDATDHGPIVGEYIGKFISQLKNEISISLEDVHLVGHSLGAQVAGFTGKAVTKLTESKVARITGLDPAPRLLVDEDGRLAPSDAELVDIIHTDSGEDSLPFSLGHINFYPNGGDRPQPGCTADTDDSSDPCSHMRATFLFVEELENNRGFLGTRCDSMQHFTEGLCRTERRITMGSDLKLSDEGNYYFYTNANYPYSTESAIDV